MSQAGVDAYHSYRRSRRLGAFCILGFASGLPLALVGGALQAWLTIDGIDLVTLGFFSLASLPYTFKFLWAPLIDRFDIPGLGRRRGWIICLQWTIALELFWLAQISPQRAMAFFAVIVVLIAATSATLDIVIDAYRTDVLEPHERGLGSAIAVFGYRVAMILSGGISLIWAAKWHSWPEVYRVMAVILLVTGLLSLLSMPRVASSAVPATRPAGSEVLSFGIVLFATCLGVWVGHGLFTFFFGDAHPSPWVRLCILLTQCGCGILFGLWAARVAQYTTLIASLHAFWTQPNAAIYLLIVLTYKAADAFVFSLSTPFLLHGMGFDQAQIGLVHKTMGLSMSVLGAMLGGVLLVRMRLSVGLFWFGILQTLAVMGFYYLAERGRNFWGSVTVPSFNLLFVGLETPTQIDRLLMFTLSLDNLTSGMATAAFVAFISCLCGTRYSASQYALLSAVSSIARVLVGPVSGVFASTFGWKAFFLLSAVAGLPSIWLVWWQRKPLDQLILRKLD